MSIWIYFSSTLIVYIFWVLSSDQGFFFVILWFRVFFKTSSQVTTLIKVAIIKKINLAKFGYILDMKVGGKKKTKSFYVLGYLLRTYHKKSGYLKLIFLWNLVNLGHFFSMKNRLYNGLKSYFLGRNLVKICLKETYCY